MNAWTGPLGVVDLEVVIKHGLHLVDGFKPGTPPLDPKMLVEQRAVEAFKDAVGLRAPHAGGAMGNVLKLQEYFIRMLVGPAAELPPIVGEYGLDLYFVRLKGRQNILIHQMHCGDVQLGWVKPGPSLAGMAINRGL